MSEEQQDIIVRIEDAIGGQYIGIAGVCRYEAAGAYLSDRDWCETGGGVHARSQGSLSTSRGVSCPSFGGPENTWCSMNEATTLAALDSLGRWMESMETANAVSQAACEEEPLRMVSQADLDAQVAEATEGMVPQDVYDDLSRQLDRAFTQDDVNEQVEAATEGMVPQEELDAQVAEAEASAQTSGGVTLTRHEHEYMKITACTAIGVCQANGMTQVRSEYSALVAECGDATWSQNGRIGDAYAVATKDVNIFQSKVGHRGTYLSHRCEDWFE